MANYKVQEIESQIRDLEVVLDVARQSSASDAASELGMLSLTRCEGELEAELKALKMVESNTALEVAVNGDPVAEHAIAIAFLGGLLTQLQKLVNAVAQASSNSQTARGSLPGQLISHNRLELASIFPSSFGFSLRLPQDPQLKLLKDDIDSPIDLVCGLLSGSEPTPQAMVLLSASRVRSHYASLVGLVAKQGATLTVRTQRYPHGTPMTAQQARDRSEWLKLQEVNSKTLEVEGLLVGGSVEEHTFQIKAVDGEEYRGISTEAAIAQMETLTWGVSVVARLEESVSTHEEAELGTQSRYRMLDVRRAA